MNFLDNRITFYALDALRYVSSADDSSKEGYENFLISLEKGIKRVSEKSMGERSKGVLYRSLDAYFGSKLKDRGAYLQIGKEVLDRLQNHTSICDSEIRKVLKFCKAFHDNSIGARQEVMPELTEVIGEMNG